MTLRTLIGIAALTLALNAGTASAGLTARGHSLLKMGIVAQVTKDEVTLSQAIERARKSFPGRLLHGETRKRQGKRVHVVVIMNDDGLVKTLRYDADTGRQL